MKTRSYVTVIQAVIAVFCAGSVRAQYPSPTLTGAPYTTGYFARHTSPLLVGQCTWYVYGRIQEAGVISSAKLASLGIFHGDAGTSWVTDAVNAHFSTGSQPRQGAIAVWTTGRGHVAFVEQVVGGVPQFSECNATPMNGWNVLVCRDDQDSGGWRVKIRSSPNIPLSGDNTIGYPPKFSVFSVIDGPTPGSNYYWYHITGNGYDGWAAFLEIDTGAAANPTDPNRDFSWSFTRIKLQPSSSSIAKSGSPDTYIYLDSQSPPDLIAQNLAVTPSSGLAGSTVNVSFTIANQGGSAANPSTANIRLATSNTSVSTSDPLLTSVSVPTIAAGGTYPVNVNVTVPSGAMASDSIISVRQENPCRNQNQTICELRPLSTTKRTISTGRTALEARPHRACRKRSFQGMSVPVVGRE